jgi:hypothetical protein
MTDSNENSKAAPAVVCVRNKTPKAAEEHLACPYCFGRKREVVEGGAHRAFCDFDEEQDPVSFGFPEGTTRSDKGQ